MNDDNHCYGGTGNGNFIVGDMNTYGTFYMSTVGVGIIYSSLLSDNPDNPTTTTTTTTSATTTETTTAKPNYTKNGTVSEVKGNDVTITLEDDTSVTVNLDTIGYYDPISVDDEVTVEFDGSNDEVVSISTGSVTTVTTTDTSETDQTTTTIDNIVTDTTTTGTTGDKLAGDVNVDGKVSTADLLLLKKHLLGISTVEGQGYINADLNDDNKVSTADLLGLKKILLGIAD